MDIEERKTDKRTIKAVSEKMVVDVADIDAAHDYTVTNFDGSGGIEVYGVTPIEGCECGDSKFNNAVCKHERRLYIGIAAGEVEAYGIDQEAAKSRADGIETRLENDIETFETKAFEKFAEAQDLEYREEELNKQQIDKIGELEDEAEKLAAEARGLRQVKYALESIMSHGEHASAEREKERLIEA